MSIKQSYTLESFQANLDGFRYALSRVSEKLESAQVAYAVVGALALSRYVLRPRMTADIDIAVSEDTSDVARAAIAGLDFNVVRQSDHEIACVDALTGVQVDWIFGGHPLMDQSVRSARRTSLMGCDVPVVRPEDLLMLYLLSDKPQHRCDALSMLRSGAVEPSMLRARLSAGGQSDLIARLVHLEIEAASPEGSWSEAMRAKVAKRGRR